MLLLSFSLLKLVSPVLPDSSGSWMVGYQSVPMLLPQSTRPWLCSSMLAIDKRKPHKIYPQSYYIQLTTYNLSDLLVFFSLIKLHFAKGH
jgi:hypothetical protein